MKQKNLNIKINHLTRIEGHGSLEINLKEGKLEKCEWQVVEAPRFFEAMIRGRHYTEVARITSRICGICAVGHTLASLKTTENALGIEVSEQTKKLRLLLSHSENFDSHILHFYFLVAPDLLGSPSALALASTAGDVVKRALRLKELGHKWGAAFSGRTTHPTALVPGGFSSFPDREKLLTLKKLLKDALPDLEVTVEAILALRERIPDFKRETEYIALTHPVEYAFYSGNIQSLLPNGEISDYMLKDYKKITNEYISPISTAKYTKNKLKSYAVGALARFNNNHEQLHPEAQKVAERLGLKPICANPYFNSVAQLVEVVHNYYEGTKLLDQILKSEIKDEEPALPQKFGRGVAGVEVPRGILFHEYEYDDQGICLGGNCVIPTNQNHANIQYDIEERLIELIDQGMSQEQIKLDLEMLVRSYDPCISCSTHYLDIKFKSH